MNVFSNLREMGVHLPLDDFGTGYSSLAYLTRLPFSKIKIDRFFIDSMLHDTRCKNLVHTVLTLVRSLGMKVVAEGVETTEQLAMLNNAGYDEAQGYLVGWPVPLDQLDLLESLALSAWCPRAKPRR